MLDLKLETKIVIAHDGRVVSWEITKSARDRALNDSVRRALRAVQSQGLHPFPEDATDSQRSFKISFDLKDKTSLG